MEAIIVNSKPSLDHPTTTPRVLTSLKIADSQKVELYLYSKSLYQKSPRHKKFSIQKVVYINEVIF